MNHRRVVWSCLSVAIALTICFSAHADGVHIPPLVYQVPATIPQQRALIAFRDGRETLIIESAFQTEAKEVGWIIPLPAVPDKILPVSSGAMKTISFRLQPKITHELPDWLTAACIITALLLFISAYVAMRPTGASWIWRLLQAISMVLFCAFLLLPGLGSARAGGSSTSFTDLGVTVQKQVQVGAYEVSILTAKNADGLNKWLADNGFMALPEKAAAVVREYIAKGWCFSAAKLQRTEGGLSTPHPIRFDFATKEAIYPMRLTAFAGAPVELEIYAIGDKEAALPPMRREFCDIYEVKAEDIRVYSDKTHYSGRGGTSDKQTVAFGYSFQQNLGHPDLTAVMWNNCVVTKLSGSIAPEQMGEDFNLSWKEAQPYRHHYYSKRGARAVVGGWAALLAALFCTACLFAAHHIIRQRGRAWFFTRVVRTGAAVLILGAAVAYLLLPKVDVRVEPGRMWRYAYWLGKDLVNSASAEEVSAAVQEVINSRGPQYARNIFVGGPIRQEISPGNYDIRQKNGVWYLVTYDEWCWESWFQISSAGK